MELTVDGLRMQVILDMPDEKKDKLPLCVIIHGFTGYKEERHIVAVSQAMNEIGIATLRVDMYGHGQSDGEFRNHTLYKWLTQALYVIDYARSLDFVTDLYLCGHSQGGLTAILAAAMKQDIIDALIPLSPAVMIPEQARAGTLLGVTFDPKHVPAELHAWDGRSLDGNYIRVAQTIDVDTAISQYTGPVLIVHGTQDEAVPLDCARQAAARFAHCEMKIIPGDTHCYDHHLETVTDFVKTWLLLRMGQKEA